MQTLAELETRLVGGDGDERLTAILGLADDLAARFAARAATYDREGSFPWEDLDDLRHTGFLALTVPRVYGGWGASLYELVRALERLGMGDGAAALAFAMSLLKIGEQAAARTWPEAAFARVCRAAVDRGALINSVASEPALGSPSRGGRPATTATPTGAGWRISGRKSFATLAPALDFLIVTAAIEDGSGDVGNFLIERGPGVAVEETWDTMGMRATASHDLLLDGVAVGPEGLLERKGRGRRAEGGDGVPRMNPWFALSVAAIYLGVGAAAHREALRFAQARVPTGLGAPLATLDLVQQRLGQMELHLRAARALLHSTARAASVPGALDDETMLDIYAAKQVATNGAIEVVDLAMRVVGGVSLSRSLPLERFYRNVRAGLFHPPADDVTLRVLAQAALAREAGA